jgi:fibronectin-binding autotransporter adhesin
MECGLNALMKSKRNSLIRVALRAFVFGLSLLTLGDARAATTHVWSGAGGDALFSNPANWSSGGAPAPGASVILRFPPAGTTQAVVNVANLLAQEINITRTPFQLAGVGDATPLTVQTVILTNNISATFASTLPVTVSSNFTTFSAWSNSTLRLNGRLQGASGVLRFMSWGQFIIGGTVANTFSGLTEVRSSSTVRLAKPAGVNALAGDVTVRNGAHLYWDAAQQLPDAGTVLEVQTADDDYAPLHVTSNETLGTLRLEWTGGPGIDDRQLNLNPGSFNIARIEVYDLETLFGAQITLRDALVVTNESYAQPVMDFQMPLQLGGHVSVRTSCEYFRFGGAISGVANNNLRLDGFSGSFLYPYTEFHFDGTNTYLGLTHVERGNAIVDATTDLGATNNGTILHPAGNLTINASMTLAEPLTIVGGTNFSLGFLSVPPFGATVQLPDSTPFVATLSGLITVTNDAVFHCGASNSLLNISGPVRGPGEVNMVGQALRFTGSQSNSFTGGFHVWGLLTELQRTLGTAVLPGPIVVHYGGTLRNLASHQIADSAVVDIDAGTYDLSVFSDTIARLNLFTGSVTGSGQLQVNDNITAYPTNGLFGAGPSVISGLLALDGDGLEIDVLDGVGDPDLRINSTISSGVFGGWTKIGAGRLELWGTNTYFGGSFIEQGTVTMKSGGALGGGGGSSVSSGAVLELASTSNVPGEYLFLDGGTLRLLSPSTNIWGGGINLSGPSRVETAFSTGRLILTNSIVGPGDLGKIGPGTLEIGGSGTNGFLGYTYVGGGTLFLNKLVGSALTGEGVIVGLSPVNFAAVAGTLHSARAAQIADLTPLAFTTLGIWNLNGFNDTIGSLQGSGTVNLGLAQLTTGGAGFTTTFDGLITGNGSISLVKVGAGTFTLTGNNAYTGRTTVSGGIMLINGTNAPGLTTISGGTLGGRGQIGNVTAQGGTLSPGTSPGILRIGNFIGNANATYRCELNNTNAGTGHDQLSVTGTVNIGSSPLQLVLGNAGAVSNRYTILVNDGTDAITSVFSGLTEGSTFYASGTPFRITYQGGTGNDVVLTQLGLQEKPQIGGIKKLPNGHMEINGTGVPNLLYSVFASTNVALASTNWLDLGLIQATPAGALQFVDPDATNFVLRFYQFVLPPFNQWP